MTTSTTKARTKAFADQPRDVVTLRLSPEAAKHFADVWRGEVEADLESPSDIETRDDLEAFLDLVTVRRDVLDAIGWGEVAEDTEIMVSRVMAEQVIAAMLDVDCVSYGGITREATVRAFVGHGLRDQMHDTVAQVEATNR
ncbi:MAG: hypothetical protein WKF94_03635 [Solirubrobacteraceae bacterium]